MGDDILAVFKLQCRINHSRPEGCRVHSLHFDNRLYRRFRSL